MDTRHILSHLHIICLFIMNTRVYGNISFNNYCTSGTNPEILPTTGKASGGVMSMENGDGKESWYEPALNCTVILSVPDGYQLLVTFSRINLRNSSLDSLVVISDDSTRESSFSGEQKCQHENCPKLMFESGKQSQNITFHFTTANLTVPLNFTGFTAVYTVFDVTIKKLGKCKNRAKFLCGNGHCIANQLVCDGHNHCGDRSDELICSTSTSDTAWGIVVIVVGIMSTLLFVPMFCFLALFGTRNLIKSVTVENQSVPMYSAVNDDETTNLLSSSGAAGFADYWSSLSQDRGDSSTYGTNSLHYDNKPSTSKYNQRSQSFSVKPTRSSNAMTS